MFLGEFEAFSLRGLLVCQKHLPHLDVTKLAREHPSTESKPVGGIQSQVLLSLSPKCPQPTAETSLTQCFRGSGLQIDWKFASLLLA